MPIPANFPIDVSDVAQSYGNDAAAGNSEVLEFDAVTRYIVLADYVALKLKAYKQTGAPNGPWALVATGPDIADKTLQPNPGIFAYMASVRDQTNKKLHAIYWSTAFTIAAVTFTPGAGFAAAFDSGQGYFGTTDAGGVLSTNGFAAAYRPTDNSVWIQFPGMDHAPQPFYQSVYAMKFSVGVGWGAATALGIGDATNFRTWTGAAVANQVTGKVLMLFAVEDKTGATGWKVLAQTINAADVISGVDTVESGFTLNPQTLARVCSEDTGGNFGFTYAQGNLTHDTRVVRGVPGLWEITQPAFIQQPAGSLNYPKSMVALAGSWYLVWSYTTPHVSQDFYWATSTAIGQGWSAATLTGSLLFADPQGISGFPWADAMPAAADVMFNVPFGLGQFGTGSWEFSVGAGPAPPAAPAPKKLITNLYFFPFPGATCTGNEAPCIKPDSNGKLYATFKGQLACCPKG